MIGLIGFYIKVELESREIIAGNPGGTKSRFLIIAFSELFSLCLIGLHLAPFCFCFLSPRASNSMLLLVHYSCY